MQIKINGQTIFTGSSGTFFFSILRREKIYFPLYCRQRALCGKWQNPDNSEGVYL